MQNLFLCILLEIDNGTLSPGDGMGACGDSCCTEYKNLEPQLSPAHASSSVLLQDPEVGPGFHTALNTAPHCHVLPGKADPNLPVKDNKHAATVKFLVP